MKNIKINIPFKIKSVLFEDGGKLENVIGMIYGDFLLIDDGSDDPPTMYNIKHIVALIEVEEIKRQSSCF